jgi:hypothetical protein
VDDVVFLTVAVLDLEAAGFTAFLGAAFLGAAAFIEVGFPFDAIVAFALEGFAAATLVVAVFFKAVPLLAVRVADLVPADLALIAFGAAALLLGAGLVALELGFAAGLFYADSES